MSLGNGAYKYYQPQAFQGGSMEIRIEEKLGCIMHKKPVRRCKECKWKLIELKEGSDQ